MKTESYLKIAEAVVFMTGLAAIIFSVFKSQTTKETIRQQNELINAQKERLDLLEKQHIENVKAIGALQGEINAYKKIPLDNIAKSLKQIAETNKHILQLIDNNKEV